MRRCGSVVAIGLLVLLGAHAGAQKPPAPPNKKAVQALLKPLHKVVRVSKVIGDAGGGRWVVLYTSHKEGKRKASATFWVGLVSAAPDGTLALGGKLALPTEMEPFEEVEPIKWGTSAFKDHDGDGKPELYVVYGYNNEPQPAVGDTYYRAMALLNVDGAAPTIALALTLDESPEADTTPEIISKLSFAKLAPGKPAEATLTTTIADYDEGSGERAPGKPKKTLYRHDPSKDVWLAQK